MLCPWAPAIVNSPASAGCAPCCQLYISMHNQMQLVLTYTAASKVRNGMIMCKRTCAILTATQ